MLIEIPALQTIKTSVEIKVPAFYKRSDYKCWLLTENSVLIIYKFGMTLHKRETEERWYLDEVKDIIEHKMPQIEWNEGILFFNETLEAFKNVIPEPVSVP